MLAEQGPDEGDVAGASADERLADAEAAAHLALGVGEAMGGAVGAEPVGVGEGSRIAQIGLDPPRAGSVHGGEAGAGDDDLMAEPFETAGHPLTVGGGFDQDARPGTLAQDRREALGLGADALLDQFGLPRRGCRSGFPSCGRQCQYGPWLVSPLCGVDRV